MPDENALRAYAREQAHAERRAESDARARTNATWPREVRVHDPECPACHGSGWKQPDYMGSPSDPCKSCGVLVPVVPLAWLDR